MSLKRILYFMPYNPMEQNSGSRTRTLQLLEFFNMHPASIQLDFVSVADWTHWTADYEQIFKSRFKHCNVSLIYRRMPGRKDSNFFLRHSLPNFIRKINTRKKRKALNDNTTAFFKSQFDDLLRKDKYDIVVMSYVDWSSVVENNSLLEDVRLIIDTHDFLTAQYHTEKNNVDLGKTFKRELEILSSFDEIWSISADERYLFSQFVNAKEVYMPLMFERKYKLSNSGLEQKIYDLIYVAGDNPHNIKAAQWFFQTVYPKLRAQITICVIGTICNHIAPQQNIIKIEFAGTLDEYYYQSKIAICPMLSGTGVKVKVVEALAYGLPVVCNYRGLDGLPLKYDNGCLLAEDAIEFADSIVELLANSAYYETTKEQGIRMFERFFEKEKGYRHLANILHIPPKK